MTPRVFLSVCSAVFLFGSAGCATLSKENSDAPNADAGAVPAVAESAAVPAASEASSAIATKESVPAAAESDTPRSTWRAEREARAASANANSSSGGRSSSSSSEMRSAGSGDVAKLTEQLTAAAKELASLRAANAKLRAERGQSVAVSQSSAKADPVDEKIAGSLKSYAAFKQEVAAIFAETERVRQENTALASNLKLAVEQAEKARAAMARLEQDLRAERRSNDELEKTVTQLRDQLRAVARAVSAAGLSVEKLSESSGKR
jgi:chromosome segregation ATPase